MVVQWLPSKNKATGWGMTPNRFLLRGSNRLPSRENPPSLAAPAIAPCGVRTPNLWDAVRVLQPVGLAYAFLKKTGYRAWDVWLQSYVMNSGRSLFQQSTMLQLGCICQLSPCRASLWKTRKKTGPSLGSRQDS